MCPWYSHFDFDYFYILTFNATVELGPGYLCASTDFPDSFELYFYFKDI